VSLAGMIWGGLTVAGVMYEGYTLFNKRKEDTLSATTRAVFQTRRSKTGRVVFGVAWTGFSAWYLGHILDWWW